MENIPSILDFAEALAFLRGYPSVYIVLFTSALILIIRDWRWSILALTIQYLVIGLLFLDVLLPHLAFMKVIVGQFICLILYITARQISWGQLPVDVTPQEAVLLGKERFLRFGPYLLPTNTPFRLFFALLIVIVVFALSQQPQYRLPIVEPHQNLAIFGLIGLGLAGMSITSEPLKAGMGLFVFLMGFELFYSFLDQSIGILSLLAFVSLALSLVISYLIQVRHSIAGLID